MLPITYTYHVSNGPETWREQSGREALALICPMPANSPEFIRLYCAIRDLFHQEPSVVIQLPYGTIARISTLVEREAKHEASGM